MLFTKKNRIENMLVLSRRRKWLKRLRAERKQQSLNILKEWFYNMVNVIGYDLPAGKTYYFDPLDFDIKQGDSVIVETSRGIEYGEVVMSKRLLITTNSRNL